MFCLLRMRFVYLVGPVAAPQLLVSRSRFTRSADQDALLVRAFLHQPASTGLGGSYASGVEVVR